MHFGQDKNRRTHLLTVEKVEEIGAKFGDTCKKNVGSTSAGNGAAYLHYHHELPYGTTVVQEVCDGDLDAKLNFLYRYAHGDKKNWVHDM